MSEGIFLQPNYRWFDFDPKDDITVKDLVAIFKAMRLSLSEDILAINPHLFKHFKVRESDAVVKS